MADTSQRTRTTTMFEYDAGTPDRLSLLAAQDVIPLETNRSGPIAYPVSCDGGATLASLDWLSASIRRCAVSSTLA
jgi:hypothetical protein